MIKGKKVMLSLGIVASLVAGMVSFATDDGTVQMEKLFQEQL